MEKCYFCDRKLIDLNSDKDYICSSHTSYNNNHYFSKSKFSITFDYYLEHGRRLSFEINKSKRTCIVYDLNRGSFTGIDNIKVDNFDKENIKKIYNKYIKLVRLLK